MLERRGKISSRKGVWVGREEREDVDKNSRIRIIKTSQLTEENCAKTWKYKLRLISLSLSCLSLFPVLAAV